MRDSFIIHRASLPVQKQDEMMFFYVSCDFQFRFLCIFIALVNLFFFFVAGFQAEDVHGTLQIHAAPPQLFITSKAKAVVDELYSDLGHLIS